MTELGRTTTLEGIVEIAKSRRKMLGLSQIVLDDMSGLQTGYTGKLECGDKGLGKTSVPLLLGALGLELAVMPATSGHLIPSPNTKAYAKRSDYFRRRAMKAAAARYANQTPKERREAARAAAKARWRKVKAERERT